MAAEGTTEPSPCPPTTWTNTYDADGLRTKRTNGSSTYEYIYLDGQLVKMIANGVPMTFAYDAEGKPISIYYNETAFYYYVTNAQGDVVGIIDKAGNKVVTYSYDAWGNLLGISGSMASTLGIHNPLRYRGYVYDSETKLYYLQSRYYDAEIGRFLSPEPNVFDGEFDEGAGSIGYNVYAYCANNPMSNIDLDGEAVANIVGGIVGGVAGAALGYLLAKQLGLTGWKKTALIAAATIGGAALGAFLGPYVAKLAKAVGSAAKKAAKVVVKKASKASKTVKAAKTLCFVAGTLVETQDGHEPIETIETGDYVYAEDPETGEKALKKVVQTFVNQTYELVHIKVNGEQITTTPGHPFYVKNKGWVGADELNIGDVLISFADEDVYIDDVRIEISRFPVNVYNFEVEDFHTYFVGEEGVLVHNKGCSMNKLSSSYLKKTLKLDAHAIKREYLGKKAKIALYDLMVDKKTRIIYIVDKAGKIITETIYKTK